MDPPSRRPPRGKVRRLGRLGNLNAGEKKTHHDLLRRPAKKAKMTVSFRYGRSDGRQLENGASRGLRFHDRAPALPSTRPPSGPYEDQPYDRYVGRRPHATGECPASHPRRADAARTVAAATVANPERGGGSDAGRSDRSDGAGATLQELFLNFIRTGGTGGAKAGRSRRKVGALEYQAFQIVELARRLSS